MGLIVVTGNSENITTEAQSSPRITEISSVCLRALSVSVVKNANLNTRFIKYLTLVFAFAVHSASAQNDTLNQTDANGLKQGYWIFYGKDMPEKGYCDTCRIEEGYYQDSKKNGVWKIYHVDNKTVRLTGTFVNGKPQGTYIKYTPAGRILEIGCFSNGKQTGSFREYYGSGCLEVKKTYNINGKEEEWSIYYYDNCDTTFDGELIGSVEKKFQKVNGISIGTGERYWPSGCLKELIYYGEDGIVLNSKVLMDDCPDSLRNSLVMHSAPLSEQISCGPWVKMTTIEKFDPNGMNKVYDKNGNLFMEGQFKDGEIWDGKVYSYDEDGILTKIEVWKDGNR